MTRSPVNSRVTQFAGLAPLLQIRAWSNDEMIECPKRIDGLEINQVEDGFIIYEPKRDRVHYLNHTAVLILELCNGRNSPAEIARLVQAAYSLSDPPQKEVDEILARIQDEGLTQ